MDRVMDSQDETLDIAAQLVHAAELMQRALTLLDHAGEALSAVYLQHALDTLNLPPQPEGSRH